MKKTFLLLTLAAFALGSCSSDDDNINIPTITLDSMKGDYNNASLRVNDAITEDVQIKVSDKIEFTALPVDQIIDQLVGKDEPQETRASIEPIAYNIPYTGVLNNNNIELQLAPEALTFNLQIGEEVKTVQVTFASEAIGRFDGNDQTLTFSFTTDKVVYGDEEVTDFEAIEYQLLPTKKKAIEVDVKEVIGNYEGEFTTIQSEDELTATSKLEVTATTIAVEALPINHIIQSIVKDDELANTILEDLNISYDLEYTATISKEQDELKLTFATEPLTLNFMLNEEEKEVVITFSAEEPGVYTIKDKALYFNFTTDLVTVNGEEVTPFEAVTYQFQSSSKE